ncbi:tRNA guanosine(34) transglycosylase Tgt [Candidatus Gottesmanbacteria bacterium CG11_big_fil_rev_8_21_14_0_20_37_11]|uniref:Queuine tRNA-ribosyltransferase n=3 Tax=Candidatus Gottesmaniibacteriota TaxID=1752720 RepID=A0A2M7RQU6_9BACT|nr:MAG: hypothetical protein AUJ73_02865 [Candidatus Gottesmanbacteria bacterium CG1_02_37_22]PIP32749.1 MAG: tRNA guanosine(34) transglycosylase Tgt [Candidatus Gottesmanbacteria bacterium CG23_combo_of_CG06-09_8_20_14_all_37_19]PIR08208.1 MAG: tRNA guanosine(34) transglycosylase Tgt [Candidatus Gottesmanbacteria bacterium CG11_big_fil_rev_8_21_14_0_20_37_11]PIZ02455.1 MAG: tRNA guanosine(34) transglycosylase Tgt [Candidatus Gottesmanbacteria bacterium CG_4_10_14_0_8_um_filter_37_24]
MSNQIFKVTSYDKKTNARRGIIFTNHGLIQTPAFVPVGTAATVKSLTPSEIKDCNIDVFFVNTYHMLFRPGLEVIKKYKNLHEFMNWKGPLMTDSGGFQAFSLGEHGPRNNPISQTDHLIQINDEGINCKSAWDGKNLFIGPQESIKAQKILGADILMSFDECTFYPITKKRALKALERTHKWARICLKQRLINQLLYGIVQGSVFHDLRMQSAKFISELPFAGFAIGSVANSKEPREKVFQVLDWTLPILLSYLKPIHFLGIGEIEDIFISVSKGIDSLDCVTPTRLARMGWIFNKEAGLKNKFRYDIGRSEYIGNKTSLEKGCKCFTCNNFTKGYLNHLFRCRELLYYRLATIHNLNFFGNLMKKIRQSISEGIFTDLKDNWLYG